MNAGGAGSGRGRGARGRVVHTLTIVRDRPGLPPLLSSRSCRYDDNNFLDARAFVVTFLINNSLNETYLDIAYQWELAMVDYMNEFVKRHPELRVTFFTESGVEIELARESASDLVTVAISYIVMLLYVSIALGRFSSIRRLFIDTKFSLGIAGVFICICSVLVSVGIFRSVFKFKMSNAGQERTRSA